MNMYLGLLQYTIFFIKIVFILTNDWSMAITIFVDLERRIMSGINLDNLSADQMLAGAAALQGDAKDYSNTQDVEGKFELLSPL